MMMHMGLMLFVSLGIGYVLCVLANKEKGNLRVLGFSLGISIIVLTLMFALAKTYGKECMMMMGKKGMSCCPMMKCETTGKAHR